MARQPLDPPSEFGLLVARSIRREMGDRRMSGRELARQLGKSEAYVRERLNDKFEFTLGDVERFTDFLGVLPEDFIAAIERLEQDDLARRRSARTNVGDPREDQLPAAAKKKSRDRGEEPEAP